jgi:hypothetical protein
MKAFPYDLEIVVPAEQDRIQKAKRSEHNRLVGVVVNTLRFAIGRLAQGVPSLVALWQALSHR